MKVKEKFQPTPSYSDVLNKAIQAFKYDKDRAYKWYLTKLPQCDNLSPYQMCKSGKSRAMIRLLETLLVK